MTDGTGSPGGAGQGSKQRATGPSAAAYAGLGFQILGSILLFLYAGQWLDRRVGTRGLFTVVGVFVGAGAAFYSLYRRLTADQRRQDSEGAP